MGTTLTGTTPQDTYDSLIKVTDNGPLSGTAKYLSDGLGNDSVLALSTTQVGVGATTLFTKMSIANSLSATSIGTNYNAGILNIQNTNTTNGNLSLIGFQDASASINLAALGAINTTHSSSPNSVVGELAFYTKPSGSGYVTEKMRITSAGSVGIGTDAPANKLSVRPSDNDGILISSSNDSHTGFFYFGDSSSNTVGSISYDHFSDVMRFNTGAAERFRITANGVTFNGDTAAANALDDYEEGTWTPVLAGNVTAGTGTYTQQVGKYTKIGNVVRIHFSIQWTSHTGTGVTTITGFPFASGSGAQTPFSVFTYGETMTAGNVPNGGLMSNGATLWEHWQIPTGGGIASGIPVYNGTAEIQVSGTYSV
jgi:hypothetical protein